VFAQINGTWELAGIMLAILPLGGQPAGTAVYGECTYFADLRGYSGGIQEVVAAPVPEPSALVLFGAGAVGLFAYACRKRARALQVSGSMRNRARKRPACG
jgi:hypothetical protein